LIVENCPPVEMEVAAIRAGLLPWDDLFLAPEPPGPLPPLKIYVAPASKHPHRPLPNRAPGEPDLIDTGLRECEANWVSRYVEQRISERLGHSDWGEAKAGGESRHLFVTIESFEAIPRFLDIIAAMREAMASLRYDYEGAFMIALRTPRAEPTPAQQAMIEEAQEEEDKADFERWQRERAEYLERKHRYELKKQDGSEINPEEFAPGPENWEGEEEGDDNDDSDDEEFEDQDDSDLADEDEEVDVLSLLDDDDEHPLADEYRILADIKGNTVWFVPHQRTLAVQLMGREPDEEYPDDET
jgi:hypothetical protein